MTGITTSALQGSFAEHVHALQSLPEQSRLPVIQVRTPADLAQCRGLIIPGGESTAIALLINQSGLYEPLLEFVRLAKQGTGERAIWGTCAGAILLAREIDGPTTAGWKGLDAIDVRVSRNRFGRQLQSFAEPLVLDFLSPPTPPLLATFIRAPALHSLLSPLAPSNPNTEGDDTPAGPMNDVVMWKQGDILASSWHPELNKDDARVHEWWVRTMVLHEP
ncbi:SNO glutamine amidotransferase [Rhodotorula sp. JG-1b]|nr:SNO glutamine amidotransferase [Rhodotorula sp. JG-1b]